MPLITNKLHFFLMLIVAGVVTGFAPVAAFGQTTTATWLTDAEREWLKAHPTIRVAPTPDFPPFEYWGGNGEFQGVVSEYLDHFEKILGVKFELVRNQTWSQNLEGLEQRKFDAIPLIAGWKDRPYVSVSDPYVSYPAVIVVQKSDTRKLSLKDLSGKRVAVPRGYTGESFLHQSHPDIDAIPADDPAHGVRMVSTGEVDAFFGGSAIVAYMAQREGITNLRIAGESDFEYVMGFGIRDDWKAFSDIISKTLKRITPTQRDAMHEKWISEDFFRKKFYERRTFWWLLGSIGGLVLAGSAASLFWNRHQAMFIDQLEEEKQRTETARREAESANRAKSKFVAHVSHEIRTPMNGVLGMCELLGGTSLDQQQSEYVHIAKHSAETLVSLINDILDFSKMEAGKLELDPRPFSLYQLLDELAKLMQPQVNAKGNTLTLDFDPDAPRHCHGDSLRVRQILLNLMSNANKFTDGGTIKVRVCKEPSPAGRRDIVRFEVRDSGIGVAPDRIEHIFEPFEQAESDTTHKFGGTGLGLSICRTLAKMMGGDTFATSEPGKGSTFGFTAQLRACDAKAVQLEDEARSGASAASQPRHVLLADDGLVNQTVAKELLQARGHTVDVVENGKEALEAISAHQFDICLMDIEMPVMDGLTAVRTLRQQEANGPRLKVVAITGHAMSGDRERFLAAGMDGHLVKPFNPGELYHAVESTEPNSMTGNIPGLTQQPTMNNPGEPPAPEPPPQKVQPGDPESQKQHSLIDRATALETTGGDEALADDLLQICLDESPAIIARARDFVRNGDYASARRSGHSLKSGFGAVGALAAAELASALEQCDSDDASRFDSILHDLDQMLSRLGEFRK